MCGPFCGLSRTENVLSDEAEVFGEMVAGLRAAGGVGDAEQRGGVDGGHQSGAHSVFRNSPRCWVTRKAGPRRDWAAVAPRQTISFGLIASISASSQGRQAVTSRA